MFTGIIEETGTIRHISRESNSARLSVAAARVLEGTSEGDSIAVNGVCLTVTSLFRDGFTADAMPETLARSTLGGLKSGDRDGRCHAGDFGAEYARRTEIRRQGESRKGDEG